MLMSTDAIWVHFCLAILYVLMHGNGPIFFSGDSSFNIIVFNMWRSYIRLDKAKIIYLQACFLCLQSKHCSS